MVLPLKNSAGVWANAPETIISATQAVAPPKKNLDVIAINLIARSNCHARESGHPVTPASIVCQIDCP
jgi:hypothetical protein